MLFYLKSQRIYGQHKTAAFGYYHFKLCSSEVIAETWLVTIGTKKYSYGCILVADHNQ